MLDVGIDAGIADVNGAEGYAWVWGVAEEARLCGKRVTSGREDELDATTAA